ncbi:MAG: energy-coupling factor transporter ATPase [Christensenellales bacterium]
MPIIIENLSHVYGKGTPFLVEALKGVSFKAERGELTGIIGHTGSGKSTLAQHLNGLETPESGRVVVDDVDLSQKYDKKAIRTKVGMVFQYPEQQLFEETVEKDICFGPKNLGLNEEEQKQRARHAMDLMSLSYEEYAQRSPFDLSGGQKRRVAIAGVLAMEPDYLVLDEPTAGLDPEARKRLLTMIRRLPEETGMGVLMVSHSMEDMAMYADKIAVMDHGRLLRFGTPEQVFSEPEVLEKAGLGIPILSRLTLALKEKGLQLPFSKTAEEFAKNLKQALEGRGQHGDE